MKELKISNKMKLNEQRRRNSVNEAIKCMKQRNIFTEDSVRNYLLNQTSFDTYGGFIMTYGEALNYYDEIMN